MREPHDRSAAARPSAARATRTQSGSLWGRFGTTVAALVSIVASAACLSIDARGAVPTTKAEALPTTAAAFNFAWIRSGDARLWQLGATGGDGQRSHGEPLPASLETPLGSVWKLFVYGYLVDRGISAPDYACTGGDADEVYCCITGGRVDRDRALVQSCGLFFDPRRLHLNAADWTRYWSAANAPAWLRDLRALTPEQRVRIADLLAALQAMPPRARDEAANTLVSVITSGRGQGTVPLYGSLLRVKTWTMSDPARPRAHIGGAAGWLADGTPVWIGGRGSSVEVLSAMAPRIAPLLARINVPDDSACVVVDFFTRYPIREVLGAGPAGRPARPGPLRGAFRIRFENGNSLDVRGRGELTVNIDAGRPRIFGRMGLNEYVARVVEREGDTSQPQAARALAIAARSYLVQHAERAGRCLRIDDSSATQRVLAHEPQQAARDAANFTDGLVLGGVSVQYHRDEAAPGQMAWLAAKAAAGRGMTFDAILARTWPQATLTSYRSSLSSDCVPVAGADGWLRRQSAKWARRLDGEAGYEMPDPPAICAVTAGRPYADSQRNRIYIYGLKTDDDRIALAHEYLHLAFAGHPRGQDERFVETAARALILTGN